MIRPALAVTTEGHVTHSIGSIKEPRDLHSPLVHSTGGVKETLRTVTNLTADKQHQRIIAEVEEEWQMRGTPKIEQVSTLHSSIHHSPHRNTVIGVVRDNRFIRETLRMMVEEKEVVGKTET